VLDKSQIFNKEASLIQNHKLILHNHYRNRHCLMQSLNRDLRQSLILMN